mmetsp:Transcript_52283/g.150582  ORF Transcript_52283/g.150582 Transcript_52283/m.150582 type:complete len:548 (-) Transcript_52283:118-1761(-)
MRRFSMAAVAGACPSLLLSWPRGAGAASRQCPAGRGYPEPTIRICQICPEGTYSPAGASECSWCPRGTWNAKRGAASLADCHKCPQGTWSSQEGSPSNESCTGCFPGHFGHKEGLGGPEECAPCPVGTWATAHGATNSEVCRACPKGTWGSIAGASSMEVCIACPKGTWSDEVGLPRQEDCRKCPAGTWGEEIGAQDAGVCQSCPAGLFQPAEGQANRSICRGCSPGTYSALPGAATCTSCPAGTFAAGADSTACEVCPGGSWTSSAGAPKRGACAPCPSGDCLRGRSVRLVLGVSKLDFPSLSPQKQVDLRENLAKAIATFFELPEASVVDTHGRTAAVDVDSATGRVMAYLLQVAGESMNDLAERFYSDQFRTHVSSAVALAVGTAAHLTVVPLESEPSAFEPLPTEAATEGATKAATTLSPGEASSTSAAASPAPAAEASAAAAPSSPHEAPPDSRSEADRAAGEAPEDDEYLPVGQMAAHAGEGSHGGLAWPWFAAGGIVAMLLVAVCVAFSHRRTQAKRLREEEEQAHVLRQIPGRRTVISV